MSVKKGSVLLVDDEQNILKTVTICLESAGFEVNAFLNPIQARDALQHRRYDLAFFDLKMQPIDGIQLLKDADWNGILSVECLGTEENLDASISWLRERLAS